MTQDIRFTLLVGRNNEFQENSGYRHFFSFRAKQKSIHDHTQETEINT